MDHESARIRRYQRSDLDDLYRVCLQTADSGQDGAALFRDPRLPGHVYAAPYAIFEPSLAFVAEDVTGVGGYVVAARDSQAFQQRLEQDWWPALRARYPDPAEDMAAGLSGPEQFILHYIHHPWPVPGHLARHFPSHLHINLLPALQGRGLGRHLVETLTSNLRDQGSPGVHLFVQHSNQRAIAFYRHLGFTELSAADVHLFAMDLTDLSEQQAHTARSGS